MATEKLSHGFEYDLVVVGGGSGGLACAKAAAELGAKVALLDFVKPSTQGTTWGLGGTCVNVGCIPKKIMHQAALLGEATADAEAYGWEVERKGFSWEKLVQGVRDYIGSLNWGYRTDLRSKSVSYKNVFGTFVDEHTIECTDRRGRKTTMTSDKFVIAVGGRPQVPDIPGAKEHCITSDDLFYLGNAPGKTLCVGGSYVSLECAGFLHGLGFDVTAMIRSIPLRGFDQQMAGMIVEYMEKQGVSIARGQQPTRIEKLESGKLRVFSRVLESGEEVHADFDTVMMATGRYPVTRDLGLDKLGVEVHEKTGFILGRDGESTNVSNIFAIGDVLHERPELTPVAILAGKLLARRLYGGSSKMMEYENVATTVFTPLEYGSVGLSEEAALERFGEESVEVYHTHTTPLEWRLPGHRADNQCYVKVICNRADQERVIGIHYLGPNAGEVIQGFSAAVRLGATKDDLDMTVGIHPTMAEELTLVHITKRSGVSAMKSGC